MDYTETAGSIIVEDGKILLLYDEEAGFWEVPGGKVEDEETATEAALRHSKQSIGVDLELRKPFYSGEFEKNGELYLWHCYLAETDDQPEIDGKKYSKLEWFEGPELDEIDLAKSLEMVLPALRKL